MPTTCFDNSVWTDLRLRALYPSLRAAFPVLVTRLQAYGDGALDDRELRVDLLGPKRFSQLADALIAWGWLTRTEGGRLARSGTLAPVSADALRMRQRRQAAVDPGDVCLTEIQRQLAEIAARIAPLFSDSRYSAADRTHTEREPYTARTHPIPDSESDSDPTDSEPIPTDGSDPTPALHAGAPLPASVPRTPLFDKLRTEGFPPDLLAEAARRVGERNLWKERYIRKVLANLLKEWQPPAQQAMPLLGTVPGGSATTPGAAIPNTQHPTPHTQTAGLSLEELVEKNARLWGEHKAKQSATGGPQ